MWRAKAEDTWVQLPPPPPFLKPIVPVHADGVIQRTRRATGDEIAGGQRKEREESCYGQNWVKRVGGRDVVNDYFAFLFGAAAELTG